MDEFESTEKHYVMVLSATDKQYQAPLSEIVSAAQDRQMFQYFPRLIDKHCTLLETLQVALENWRWVAAGVLAGVVFPSVCLSFVLCCVGVSLVLLWICSSPLCSFRIALCLAASTSPWHAGLFYATISLETVHV
jgi:hypothetical protein